MINFSKLVLLIDQQDLRLNLLPPELDKESRRVITLRRLSVLEAIAYIMYEDAGLRPKVSAAIEVLMEYRKAEGMTNQQISKVQNEEPEQD